MSQTGVETLSQTLNAFPVERAGETVLLLPDRAVFWPSEQTVIVADVHWGKEATFQRFGIGVPGDGLQTDLERLARLIETTQAQRLLVLGDLIHGQRGLTQPVVESVTQWRQQYPVELVLVLGNHDRHAKQLPDSWQIQAYSDPIVERGFYFDHEPPRQGESLPESGGTYGWFGHVHPMVRLGRRKADKMRLPCYHLTGGYGVLPSFGSFTGGFTIQPRHSEHVIAIADGVLVDVDPEILS